MASMIVYSVTASFESLAVANEYVQWLQGGHLQQVLDGGALEASLVRFEPTSDAPLAFQSRYVFASMQTFTRYEHEVAPALRAEGAAKFPTSRGVRMTRAVAELLTALTRS